MSISKMGTASVVTYFCLFYCSCFAINDTSSPHSHILTDLSDDSTRNNGTRNFHLTKLLDIRMEDDSNDEPLPSKNYLRAMVEAEVIKAVNETNTFQKGPVDFAVQKSVPDGHETLLFLLDSLSKEIKGVKNSLKILDDNIASIKKSTSPTLEECPLNVQSNQVGVSYNRKKVLGTSNKAHPKNCKEVLENGYNTSGIYEIHPRNSDKPFMVLCDMETNGGGWTHIQKRFDGSQDFFLDYRNYKFGFGNLEGEFWLGLEKIYLLTAFEVNELLVEIVDRDGKSATAKYNAFGISSETGGYNLNVLRGFSGDAGDSLVQHLGSNFSTRDYDQDAHEKNCAELYKGGWWYKGCHVSNLNGKYINVNLPAAYKFQGMHWLTFRSHEYCHSKSRMLVRPTQK